MAYVQTALLWVTRSWNVTFMQVIVFSFGCPRQVMHLHAISLSNWQTFFHSSLHGGGNLSKGLFRDRISGLLPASCEPGPHTCIMGTHIQDQHSPGSQCLCAPFHCLFMPLASGEFSFFPFNLAINFKVFCYILFRTSMPLEQERGRGVHISANCHAAGR